jgi:hypothetical protein
LDEFSRVVVRVGVVFEDLFEGFCFTLSGDEKDDRSRRVDGRDGQRQADGVEFLDRVFDDPPVARIERQGAGKEARGVTILAYPEQDEIQDRRAAEEFF